MQWLVAVTFWRTVVADHFLDTKGLNCPLPILKAKKALISVAAGETLEVHATDPGAVDDFDAFCRRTNNDLLEHTEEDDVFRFIIKKLG